MPTPHLPLISPLGERGWEGVPDDYNQFFQHKPLGYYPDLQLYCLGPELSFCGFTREHPSPHNCADLRDGMKAHLYLTH